MGAIIAHHGLLLGGVAAPVVTWNPSDKSASITLSGSNLIASRASGSDSHQAVRATTAKASGKFYFECRITGGGASPGMMLGVGTSAASLATYVGGAATSYGCNVDNGHKYTSGIDQGAYGVTAANGDVLGVAFDATASRLYFAKNNTWMNSGDPVGGTNYAFAPTAGSYFPMCSLFYQGAAQTWVARFRSADFTYSPPSGYSAWE